MSEANQKNCIVCGNLFEIHKFREGPQKFCTIECAHKALKKKKIQLHCQLCGKEFIVQPSGKDKKYCTRECYFDSKKYMVALVAAHCESCGKEFEFKKKPLRPSPRFCSDICRLIGIKRGPRVKI